MCILLVEDEPVIRMVFAEFFADEGFAVCEAADADQAQVLIEQEGDQLIALVTDIHIPGGLDGIELAAALRVRRPDIPRVYMTGQHDALDILDAIGAREGLLQKPFDGDELVATVRRLLDA